MASLEVQRIPVTPLRQNCTVLSDGQGRAVVIDPGGDVDDLLTAVEGQVVEAILLTHGHFDHAGGADALRERLNDRQETRVPVLGPDRRDAFLLSGIEAQAASLGLSGLRNVKPDRFLAGGETLSLLGHELTVEHVPGHTPGHVVFIDRASQRAIVGDTLFRNTVGRTDFPYGDHEALLAGIKRHLLTLPEHTVVLCGHGLPTTIGEERQSNPFFAHQF
ncbi:MBL fold metallo-hydrolase [Gluconobacter morbifer]|uniref:Metallo-beta-lactamase superfamily protein n=1 Tax=Gluconobacter morbifer G707 TaxID=1088869 RepID=G6XKN1_9PROT|nr:MBL fold metallo-hydrolase [Gluconobacter morbifer]EHH67827.1 metallo-beta-lactamase superfamily protein [Gluconobacter morbifer G707]